MGVLRKAVFKKRNGRCAYCGSIISEKAFHVDHVEPCYRNNSKFGRNPEDYTIDELEPSCPRCNMRKSVLTLEQFRSEISHQVERVRRDSSGFRLAEDFGLIQQTGKRVVFYFEDKANEELQNER